MSSMMPKPPHNSWLTICEHQRHCSFAGRAWRPGCVRTTVKQKSAQVAAKVTQSPIAENQKPQPWARASVAYSRKSQRREHKSPSHLARIRQFMHRRLGQASAVGRAPVCRSIFNACDNCARSTWVP